MIAEYPCVEIKVEGDNITVIKMFIFRSLLKIAVLFKDMVWNVYFMEERRKHFVDGMTDHFDNFYSRIKKWKRDYYSRNTKVG